MLQSCTCMCASICAGTYVYNCKYICTYLRECVCVLNGIWSIANWYNITRIGIQRTLIVANFWFLGASPCPPMFHRDSSVFFVARNAGLVNSMRNPCAHRWRMRRLHSFAAWRKPIGYMIYSSLEKMLMGWMFGKTILNHPQKYQRWHKPSTYKFYPLYSSIPSGDAA